jgi:IS30 family transposase
MTKHHKLSVDQRLEIGTVATSKPCVSKIARRFKCSRDTVNRWLHEGRKVSINYTNSTVQGRKSSLSAIERSQVRRWAKAGETAGRIGERRARLGRKPASRSTILRVLKGGMKPLAWRRSCSKKGLSGDNLAKRLAFCRNNLRADVSTCVFLDANYLCLSKGGSCYYHYSWQVRDEPPPAVGTGASVVFMFYAAVALGHKSQLNFVPP